MLSEALDEKVRQPTTGPQRVALFAALFAWYVVSYAVVIYFNAALIAAAYLRLQGARGVVGDGIRAANACLGSILAYALIAATVGVLLNVLRQRSEGLLRFATHLGELAWNVVTFLVVPIIVLERAGAVRAIGRSAQLLRETWGERLVTKIGFGGLSTLIGFGVIAMIFVAAGVYLVGENLELALGVIGLAVVGTLLAALLLAGLRGIYVAALYAYATQQPLGVFPTGLVTDAFHSRDA